MLIRQRLHGLRVLFVHLPVPDLRSRPHLHQASPNQAALCNADAKAEKHASDIHPELPQFYIHYCLVLKVEDLNDESASRATQSSQHLGRQIGAQNHAAGAQWAFQPRDPALLEGEHGAGRG